MGDVLVKNLMPGMKFTPRLSGFEPREVVWVNDKRNSPYDFERGIEVCYRLNGVACRDTFTADAMVRLVEDGAP